MTSTDHSEHTSRNSKDRRRRTPYMVFLAGVALAVFAVTSADVLTSGEPSGTAGARPVVSQHAPAPAANPSTSVSAVDIPRVETTTARVPDSDATATVSSTIRSTNGSFVETVTGTAGSAQSIDRSPAGSTVELLIYGGCRPGGSCQLNAEIHNSTGHSILVADGYVTVSAICDGLEQRPTHLTPSVALVEAGQGAVAVGDAPATWQGSCELSAAFQGVQQ